MTILERIEAIVPRLHCTCCHMLFSCTPEYEGVWWSYAEEGGLAGFGMCEACNTDTCSCGIFYELEEDFRPELPPHISHSWAACNLAYATVWPA